MKEKRKTARIFAGLLLFLLAGLWMLPASAETRKPDTAYSTELYEVNVTLSEQNVYHVEETIQVDFHTARHGLYRYIPYEGEVETVGPEGEPVYRRYRAKISNIQVEGWPCSVSWENGNAVLRIGEEDSTVRGEQTYRISFDFDAGEDGVDSMDQIYLNLIPQGWQTGISKARFSLTLPKEVPAEAFSFTQGGFGSTGETDFRITQEGRVWTGESSGWLPPFEGLTVRAVVEEGYFQNERVPGLFLRPLAWALLILLPAGMLFLYLKIGRDPRIIPVMTVSPPAGMTSAEAGVVIDGMASQKDLLSLIVYWASKGLLMIQEEGSDLILTRRSSLPGTAPVYERTLFDGLFQNGEQVKLSELKGTFYHRLALALQLLSRHFSHRKGNALYTKGSLGGSWAAFAAGLACAGVGLLLGGWLAVASAGILIVGAVGLILLVPAYVGLMGLTFSWHKKSRAFRIAALAGCLLAGLGGTGGAAFLLWRDTGAWGIPLLGIAGAVVCGVLCCVMPRRTEQCAQWMGELLGLREFILYAEKERLEQLAEENPESFYEILPFAYVLDVSDVWCRRLEELAVEPPDWYQTSYGTRGYFNYLVFRSCMNQMSQTLAVPPPETKGSSGRFGSSSGGGFSGGGFSGGGGGSW